MFTVGEEGRVLELLEFLRFAEIDGDLFAVMADDEFSAAMRGRQGDDERAEHGFDLLGVAVGEEVTTLLVDQ